MSAWCQAWAPPGQEVILDFTTHRWWPWANVLAPENGSGATVCIQGLCKGWWSLSCPWGLLGAGRSVPSESQDSRGPWILCRLNTTARTKDGWWEGCGERGHVGRRACSSTATGQLQGLLTGWHLSLLLA